MKTLRLLLACAALATLHFQPPTVFAQGTAFTYQGVLSQSGAAVNGSNDLTFTLYDAASAGTTVGTSNVVNDLILSNGLFTVTLDFGAGVFNGPARWLQIAARPGNSTGAYTNLAPRQAITATPYALFAGGVNASTIIGQVTDANLATTLSFPRTFSSPANQFSGVGSNLTALNASQLTSGTVPSAALSNAWKLGGNAGANPASGVFLGTTDGQPLDFKVNSQRALRLQFANNAFNQSVNVIGGHNGNFVGSGVVGAAIGGGGSATGTNRVLSDFGTVAGGVMNTAGTGSGQFGPTVGGGENNTASGTYTTVGGGNENTASGFDTTVSGGKGNSASGSDTTVGGGRLNSASALYSTVPGGFGNVASGNYSFAAGRQAQATNDGAFVWADSTVGNFASTANNQFLIRASGGVAIGTNNPAGAALRVAGSIKADSYLGMGSTMMVGTTDNQPLEFKVNNERAFRLESAGLFQSVNVIGGSSSNSVSSGLLAATIAGGGIGLYPNRITASAGTVSGGMSNVVSGDFGTVGGGWSNVARTNATVGGGALNVASGSYATIPGGYFNAAAGQFSLAAGYRAQANHDGSFVWAGASDLNQNFVSTGPNQFLIRAVGGVGIGTDSPTSGLQVGSFGGLSEFVTIATAGGSIHDAGVKLRHSNPNFGWTLMSHETDNSFRLLSHFNDATGVERLKVGFDGVIRIGGNVAISTPNPSGRLSVGTVNGTVSIADDAFTPALVMSGGPAPGILRVRNALEIWPNTGGTSAGKIDVRDTAGTARIILDGANGDITAVAVNITSDRNAKEQFKPVNARDVLAKVARLPISEWQYKQSGDARHIGPMAQDFHAAFAVGRDDKHITSVDADGVALAAIQGLNEKLEEQVRDKDARIQDLEKAVSELQQLVNKLITEKGGVQ